MFIGTSSACLTHIQSYALHTHTQAHCILKERPKSECQTGSSYILAKVEAHLMPQKQKRQGGEGGKNEIKWEKMFCFQHQTPFEGWWWGLGLLVPFPGFCLPYNNRIYDFFMRLYVRPATQTTIKRQLWLSHCTLCAWPTHTKQWSTTTMRTLSHLPFG